MCHRFQTNSQELVYPRIIKQYDLANKFRKGAIDIGVPYTDKIYRNGRLAH